MTTTKTKNELENAKLLLLELQEQLEAGNLFAAEVISNIYYSVFKDPAKAEGRE